MTHPAKPLEAARKPIQFIDLKAQQALIRDQLDTAVSNVLDHGAYIMGPEVKAFEAELAKFCGVKHAIACGNGTDALVLALMAKNVGPGDAVFVPSFTFAASAEVIALVGATPVFVDACAKTYNLDAKSLEAGIAVAKEKGLTPKAMMPVDLFGQPADYDAIEKIAKDHGLWILCDAAQGFGGSYKGRMVGNIGDIATTSFFPAKPLGCYGDGGAVFTNDDDLADIIRSLRVHGKGTDKYDNVRIGVNSRLDTVQAAILLEKIKLFPAELKARQHTAEIYNAGLKDLMQVPVMLEGEVSAWAQYTVRLPKSCDRAKLMADLKAVGIPSVVYYVKPLHLQTAYQHYPCATDAGLPVCEALSEEVMSLPMSGYVKDEDAHYIVSEIRKILG